LASVQYSAVVAVVEVVLLRVIVRPSASRT
jgi:hypothetical protein